MHKITLNMHKKMLLQMVPHSFVFMSKTNKTSYQKQLLPLTLKVCWGNITALLWLLFCL